MTLSLRPYQTECLAALSDYWREGGGNPLIVLPTGAGKSLVIATLCKDLLQSYPDMRVGIVTHVKELVSQNCAELLNVWPEAPVGIYSAGIGRRDTKHRILFMGIQSVYQKVKVLGGFDLLLIDEAHLIPRSANTMYGKFIDACLNEVSDMRIVGLTATPYRLDSGRLDAGKGALFNKVIYEANVRDLIEAGFLSPLISKATLAQIDTRGVHRRLGEFVQSELEERVTIPSVVEEAVKEIVQAGKDRAGWLVFCTSVAHSKQVRDEIRKHGISCESVTGDTPAGDRDRIIRQYKAGMLRCLTSVGVLTTGFNAPHVDLLALLRPTLSTGLYVQMVGRAFRLAPGKSNALILDFAGNIRRHGCIDDVKPQRGPGGAGDKKETSGEERVMAKECPSCMTFWPLSTKECVCGYVWPDPPARHEARAAEDTPILTTEAAKPQFESVTEVFYFRHRKPGSPDSMRVVYHTAGTQTYAEWICFEHDGWARQKAVMWWSKLGGVMPAPATVGEALERAPVELRKVMGVKVKPNGKYWMVLGVIFEQSEAA